MDLPGGRFALLQSGQPGSPLVLCLHGFPDHPPSFRPLLRALGQAGYHAAAPWLRGYAPSTVTGPFHLDRLAADVLELADVLSPGRQVALVGHDWGALTAYRVARLAPARLCGLVTLSVPHPAGFLQGVLRDPGQLARSAYLGLFQLGGLADWLVARHDLAFIDGLWQRWSPGFVLSAADREELHACLRASWPAPLGYYRALVRSPFISHRATVRGRIRVPALYLHGARDGCIDPGVAAGQERWFAAGLQSEVLAGAGHFLVNERPDQVGERIVDFLGPMPW